MFRTLLFCAPIALLVWLPLGAAFATDGVLEINQTCAVNTGCFSGDSAGFPVTITQPGSYRLTGNLDCATGWIRTGNFSSGSTTPGEGNCSAWSTTAGDGTVVALRDTWDVNTNDIGSRWVSFLTVNCTDTRRVWCVEDE